MRNPVNTLEYKCRVFRISLLRNPLSRKVVETPRISGRSWRVSQKWYCDWCMMPHQNITTSRPRVHSRGTSLYKFVQSSHEQCWFSNIKYFLFSHLSLEFIHRAGGPQCHHGGNNSWTVTVPLKIVTEMAMAAVPASEAIAILPWVHLRL